MNKQTGTIKLILMINHFIKIFFVLYLAFINQHLAQHENV